MKKSSLLRLSLLSTGAAILGGAGLFTFAVARNAEPFALEPGREIFAFQPLHDQKERARRLPAVREVANDGRPSEIGEQHRLARPAPALRFAGAELHLDRHELARAQIARAVN